MQEKRSKNRQNRKANAKRNVYANAYHFSFSSIAPKQKSDKSKQFVKQSANHPYRNRQEKEGKLIFCIHYLNILAAKLLPP
jgi:hypothetical protein